MNGSRSDEDTAHLVHIPAGGQTLTGDLAVPPGAPGIVVFAHGSGSSRHSPRNRFVAQVLQRRGLATLLFDLLTPAEDRIDQQTAQFRFDIRLLTERLLAATDWVLNTPRTRALRLGYFGASTGAGAALAAAAVRPQVVAAIVSRGGRPDLAGEALRRVRAPTLLLVGGLDWPVIAINRRAQAELTCVNRLEIIPGATHLFEEPGALETVARLAADWFQRYLIPASHPSSESGPAWPAG